MAKGGVRNMKSLYTEKDQVKPYEWQRLGNRWCSVAKDAPYIMMGGCSYTDHFFMSDYGKVDPMWPKITDDWKYAKWPEVIARILGYEKFYNCGTSGAGNPRILNILMDTIMLEQRLPDAIFVLWSGWDRFDIYNQNVVTLSEIHNRILAQETNDKAFLSRRSRQHVNAKIGYTLMENLMFLRHMAHSSLRSFYQLQWFCERNDIKLMCASAIAPISEVIVEKIIASYTDLSQEELDKISSNIWRESNINSIKRKLLKAKAKGSRNHLAKLAENAPDLLKYFYMDCFGGFPKQAFDSPFAFDINEDLHVGWPYWLNIGGMSYDCKFNQLDPVGSEYIIQRGTKVKGFRNGDFHPNEKGHELIAKDLLEAFEDVYDMANN